jgi:hypothetical protein
MASGYQPSVPLMTNSLYGPYVLTKTFNENAKQNIKMIMLTEPGEKLTDITFGCGLKRFLFEAMGSFDLDGLKGRIISQMGEYAPYIKVHDVLVNADEQEVQIQLKYTILPTNTIAEDMFEVTL